MNTFSKQITLTNLEGSLINYADFGLTDKNAIFKFLQIVRVSTGTMSIKFSLNDDYISILSYPYTFDTIRFSEFFLLPSETLVVDIVASFIPENSAIS